jgi:hypothetical protein
LVAVSALAVSACTVSSSSRRGGPPPPPPPGQWQPAGPNAGPPRITPGMPGAANAGAFTGVRPMPAYNRPVNVAALRRLKGKTKCDPEEIAPGKFIQFDCGPESRVTRALKHIAQPRTSKGFVTGAVGPLPPMVDHRQIGLDGPIKDQGAVGACTAFSLSSAMDNAIRKLGRQDTVAPLHVWSKYAVPVMGVAGDETVDERLTLEPVWPYDPAKACKLMRMPFDTCGVAYGVTPGSGEADPQLRSERQQADSSGQYQLVAVEQLQSKPPDTDEMAAVLAGGDAIWASFWVDRTSWKSSSVRNNGGAIPHYTDREDSGHAVALAGYRTLNGQRQFLVHNSWGTEWGDNGYAWLSEETVKLQLRNAYKVRISDGKGQTPPPNASGCASGQVRDSVLGVCAPLCPSGSPPAAGVCLPAVPGFPAPGPGPQNNCPQGQAPDGMTGQCSPLCPNGVAPIGGMCLPVWGQ